MDEISVSFRLPKIISDKEHRWNNPELRFSLSYDSLNRPCISNRITYEFDDELLNKSYKNEEIFQTFKKWSEYDSNAHHFGTKQQREALEKLYEECKRVESMLMKAGMKKSYYFDKSEWIERNMRMLGLEYDNGVRYTDSVYEEVPTNVIQEIKAFFEREDIKAYLQFERWHHMKTKLFYNWKKEWLANKGE